MALKIKQWPEKETQIAEPIVAWLYESGWDVFQEVTAPEGRADIVARRGRIIWAIEVKRSLSLDGQRTFAKAGNADGKFWSPFRDTCARVRDAVDAWPGLTIGEIVDIVDHHYASKQSARGSLLTWAAAGKLEGVVVLGGGKDEGACRLYPCGWVGPIEDRALLGQRMKARRADVLHSMMGRRK